MHYYQLAAGQGDACAQTWLGDDYCREGEDTQGLEYYQLAADQGYARAQHRLAVCYHNGIAVKRDKVMAAKYYLLASRQGYKRVQAALDESREMKKYISNPNRFFSEVNDDSNKEDSSISSRSPSSKI